MKFIPVFVVAAFALSACDLAIVEDTSRAAAKAVVSPIVAETVPGAAGVILTDCIIDNASIEELASLALGGASPENITLVSQILSRAETVVCATSALT